MKIRIAPRGLTNLPNGYSLDSRDKQSIDKYRHELSIKRRREGKQCQPKKP